MIVSLVDEVETPLARRFAKSLGIDVTENGVGDFPAGVRTLGPGEWSAVPGIGRILRKQDRGVLRRPVSRGFVVCPQAGSKVPMPRNVAVVRQHILVTVDRLAELGRGHPRPNAV